MSLQYSANSFKYCCALNVLYGYWIVIRRQPKHVATKSDILYEFWRFADRASQYIHLSNLTNLMHKTFVLQ